MSPFPDWQEVTLQISVLLRCLYFLNSTITVTTIFPLSIMSYFLPRSICLLTWQYNWQVSNQSNRREIIAIFIITQRLLRFNYSGSNMRVMILLSLLISSLTMSNYSLVGRSIEHEHWQLTVCEGLGSFAEINPLLHTQQSSPSVEFIMQKTHSEKKWIAN